MGIRRYVNVWANEIRGIPMNDDELDIPRHSYEDLGKRWGRSPWTVKLWVQRGRLPKPIYLSANCPRFTERQVREFEQSCPRDWKETQLGRKVIRQRTEEPRKPVRKGHNQSKK